MQNYLDKFLDIMQQENIDPVVQRSFADYYNQILAGATGKLPESAIKPPDKNNIIEYEKLIEKNSELLKKFVIIKLNGGLGTSMGLKKAKSLLRVKENNNFLDIIVKQILYLRRQNETNVPLLFMNSFNTRDDTLSYLEKYADLKLDEFPLDFVQNKFPKIKQKDLSPLQNEDKNANWNPPGHGEIYLALKISGILEQLLEQGIEYAFISNADNLGAVVDEAVLTHFAGENIPFLMEVCQRTEMDKKGGHLAETDDGHLILREVAQCLEGDLTEFQNINKYSYFNTNNLWVNLKALEKKLAENDNLMPLPLILNEKTVDKEKIFQIETAMGAAINIFENSKALIVPRSRFLPVKKTNDLLLIWSDIFELQDDFSLKCTLGINENTTISLDEKYYKNIDMLLEHFTEGIPSLIDCSSLKISGDVFFGKNVKCNGNVEIIASQKTKLENRIIENIKLKL